MDSAGLDCLDRCRMNAGSRALVRGVCAGFRRRGYTNGGFDAYTFSDFFAGSGLSSSAAYEVLSARYSTNLFNDGRIDPVEIAQIAHSRKMSSSESPADSWTKPRVLSAAL